MENNEKLSREEWVNKRMNDLVRKPFLTDQECKELEIIYKEFYEPRKKFNIKLSIPISWNK